MHLVVGVVAALATVLIHTSSARQLPYGDLKLGRFSVGFRTMIARDLGRAAIQSPQRQTSGRELQSQVGRLIQISVWYPSLAGRGGSLTIADYLFRVASSSDREPPTRQSEREAIDRFRQDTLGNAASESELRALLSLKTIALLNARRQKGRFPLLVFAPGSTSTYSMLAEYLTSHGFVVAMSALTGSVEQEAEVALTGVETQVADMQYVLRTLRADPMVDGTRIGVFGYSFGALAALALQMRNADIAAVVSLDGGIATPFGDGLMRRTPFFDESALNVPLLHLYAPHPDVRLELLDAYRYAPRYTVGASRLKHEDFANAGPFGRFAREGVGLSPDIAASYEFTRTFVRAFVERDQASVDTVMSAEKSTAATAHAEMTITIKRPEGSAPSLTALKERIAEANDLTPADLQTSLEQIGLAKLSQRRFDELLFWVTQQWARDQNGAIRHAIHAVRVEAFPGSARAQFNLGQSWLRLGDKARAKTHLEETLRVMTDDRDPLLTHELALRIDRAARRVLSELGEDD